MYFKRWIAQTVMLTPRVQDGQQFVAILRGVGHWRGLPPKLSTFPPWAICRKRVRRTTLRLRNGALTSQPLFLLTWLYSRIFSQVTMKRTGRSGRSSFYVPGTDTWSWTTKTFCYDAVAKYRSWYSIYSNFIPPSQSEWRAFFYCGVSPKFHPLFSSLPLFSVCHQNKVAGVCIGSLNLKGLGVMYYVRWFAGHKSQL